MKKHLIILASVMTLNGLQAQQPLTPEKLWELHRVSAIALTPDRKSTRLTPVTIESRMPSSA